jgi:hypothetical protein
MRNSVSIRAALPGSDLALSPIAFLYRRLIVRDRRDR